MHPAWIVFIIFTSIVFLLLLRDIFAYVVFESSAKRLRPFRILFWRVVRWHVLKVNTDQEVVKNLPLDLRTKMNNYIRSDAAKVMYYAKGYKMLSDFMVLMIDSYFSTLNKN